MVATTKMYLLLIFLPFVASNSSIVDENEWKLVTSSDKMDIYTRKTTTVLKEVKAVGTMDADLTSVITALNNVEEYTEWIYNCTESERFDVVDKTEFHYYVRTHIPFPLYDRDLVVNTKQWIDEEGYWYSYSTCKPQLKPEKSRIVRIKNFYSIWKIKSTGVHAVKFEYVLSIDPGGILPAWLINIGIKKAPVTTIEALEKRAIKLMEQ